MLRIGIIGLGHWGETCMKYIDKMKQVKMVGFVDIGVELSEYISNEALLRRYDSVEKLIDECDSLLIATPAISHYDIATAVIRQGKHLFIEYPLSQSIEEGNLLIKLIKEANVKCQISFVELFNPAYKQVETYFQDIVFVEIKHVLPINIQNLKLNMLLEILPQDIYLLLHTIKSPLKKIYAYGINIFSDNCDICSIHVEFQNGCTAHITTSRINPNEDEIYKMDLLQSNAHIKIDFLKQQSEVIFFNKINDTSLYSKKENVQVGIAQKITLQSFSNNQIYDELESFFNAITNDRPTCINEFDGLHLLEIGEEIKKQITLKNQYIKL